MTLQIGAEVYSQILAHLQAAYPNEGAGLLLGHAYGEDTATRTATSILPLANQFEQDEQYHRYLITARDMLEGETEAERLGLDVIGVFHSHPDHPARASDYDREHALPWYSYLIVSIEKGRPADARVWLLADDRSEFIQEKLTIQS